MEQADSGDVIVCGKLEGFIPLRHLTKAWGPSNRVGEPVTLSFNVETVLKGDLALGRMSILYYGLKEYPMLLKPDTRVVIPLKRTGLRFSTVSNYWTPGLQLPQGAGCLPRTRDNPAEAIAESLSPSSSSQDWTEFRDLIRVSASLASTAWYSQYLEEVAMRNPGGANFPSACFVLIGLYPQSDRCLDEITLARHSRVDVDRAEGMKFERSEKRNAVLSSLQQPFRSKTQTYLIQPLVGAHSLVDALVYLAHHKDLTIRALATKRLNEANSLREPQLGN